MILSIQNVSKKYNRGKKLALDGVSAELTPGVYGLLGANGAGKSTLMNLITDQLLPDSGEIRFNQVRIQQLGREYRNILGYMPQQQGLYSDFTAERFLWYMSVLKGLSKTTARQRIEQLLDVVNLQNDRNKKLSAFSGGMKQRILIAQALLNDPQILILDEPTAGLDPNERIRLRNFIAEIALNKIVILATHVVTDIEYISKEILLMKKGKLILKGEPHHLLERMDGKVFEVHSTADQLHKIQANFKISNIAGGKDRIQIRVIGHSSPEGYYFEQVKPGLEDLYLYFAEENPIHS